MRSNLPKILITVIFIFLLQSSKLFSQEIWDLKWTNTVTEVSGGSTETVDISPDGSKVISGSDNSYSNNSNNCNNSLSCTACKKEKQTAGCCSNNGSIYSTSSTAEGIAPSSFHLNELDAGYGSEHVSG